ncbi:hypothetical protein ABIC65_002556 [Sphingomonas trueperi]|uniref:polyprenyl synthetase family protein n=1 Tax=Sphingomonas trueperi TaxID=53317 RepID=UPI003392764A
MSTIAIDPDAWDLAEHATRYAAFDAHPGIRREFSYSLRLRTRLWQPVLDLLAGALEYRPSDAARALLGGWFAMVHLSAPIDQLVDDDPMSEHWRSLGGVGSFALVLALKDQILRAPLEAFPPGTPAAELRPIAKATIELASACLTASIGSYLDVTGYSQLSSEATLSLPACVKMARFYETLVGWKSSVIYESLMRCAALAMEAPPATVAALAEFGHHIGFAVQILDDAGGIWGDGDDLEKDPVKVTSPIAYGLCIDHARRDELAEILHTPARQRDVATARDILDGIEARTFLEFLIRERISRGTEAVAAVTPAMAARLERWAHAYFRRTL